MIILALSAFLLIGAPVGLLKVNQWIVRAMGRARRPVPPAVPAEDAPGTAWFNRPMRPAFGPVRRVHDED